MRELATQCGKWWAGKRAQVEALGIEVGVKSWMRIPSREKKLLSSVAPEPEEARLNWGRCKSLES